MTGKMTIALLKREAELYRIQGLHREAINVYEKILAFGSTLDPEVRQAAQCRVQVLSRELAKLESGPADAVSPAEVDRIRGGWGEGGDPGDPHHGARAFRRFAQCLQPLFAALANRLRAKGSPAAPS